MTGISTTLRIGRGFQVAAVSALYLPPAIVLAFTLLLLSGAAATDDLSGLGPRKNLQVALWDTGAPGEKKALEELFFSFQRANPDVIVCLEWKDAELQDEWTRRWFGGLREYAPDVTVMTERQAWENRHELLVMPDDLGRVLRRDYHRSVMQRLPGPARGIPWGISTYALYYRSDLLSETELHAPKTLEAMVETADALADPPHRFGLGFPGPSGGGEELLHALAVAMGGEIMDSEPDDESERGAGEPDYAGALELLVDLQSRGALQPETLTWGQDDLVRFFGEGRLAMVIAPISAARELCGLDDAPEWASTALPVSEDGSGYLSVQWLVVFEDTGRKEIAIRLLRYMAEAESQRMVAVLPAVPGMRRIADEMGDRAPWQAHTASLAEATGVSLPRWQWRRPQIGDALAYALSGRLSPREALSMVAETGE